MYEMGIIIFAQLILGKDCQNEMTSVRVVWSVTRRQLLLPLLFFLENILECGVGSMSRGIAEVPRKGCFLGDQDGVLSFILSYGFILVGLEAFKNPPFKRNSHSWRKGSYPRTIIMSFVMSGWLIPEQGWADCSLGPEMGKGLELGCMVRWYDAVQELILFLCYCHNVGISRHFLQLR